MQNKARLDNYIVLKTLGTGYTGKVKLGRDMANNNLYALKILDPTKMDSTKFAKVVRTLENELTMMKNLEHKNIVHFIGLQIEGVYTTKKGTQKTVAYAVIELAAKGEIFEVLFKIGPFNENMARFYMKQLIDALQYLHDNKVAHRDLKPENLLMDDKYNLKLADFGFATLIDETLKSKTKLGTERYMSPELFCKKPYDAAKVDVFASGVILFIFFSGHPPFYEAKLEDPYYKLFINNNQKFWDFHTTQNRKRIYSEGFKTLVNGMMEYDADKRFTTQQVHNSEWLNFELDEQQALEDMMAYISAMTKVVSQQKPKAVADAKKISAQNTNVTNNSDTAKTKPNYAQDKYSKIETERINMAQKDSPNVICIKCRNKAQLVNNIVDAVRNLPETKIIWNEAKDRIKIKFTTEHKEAVLIKVRIYEGKNGLFKIEFAKLEGPCFDYYKFKARFREFIEENL